MLCILYKSPCKQAAFKCKCVYKNYVLATSWLPTKLTTYKAGYKYKEMEAGSYRARTYSNMTWTQIVNKSSGSQKMSSGWEQL